MTPAEITIEVEAVLAQRYLGGHLAAAIERAAGEAIALKQAQRLLLPDGLLAELGGAAGWRVQSALYAENGWAPVAEQTIRDRAERAEGRLRLEVVREIMAERPPQLELPPPPAPGPGELQAAGALIPASWDLALVGLVRQ